ncbi:MAG: Holliday junction branch migration protein RuvA [Chloroflexota bacterium]
MISSLTGVLTDIADNSLTVEIGGVGMRVFAPANLQDEVQIGQVISLHTHLIVRETELSLYGFKTKEERHFFNLLIGVSGIGPRIALAALSTLSPNAIRSAIFQEQPEILGQVPGIGKMTAQKMVLHLKNKIGEVDGMEEVAGMDETDTELIAALTAMGFSIIEAQSAVQFIPNDTPDDLEIRLKLALQYFSSPS